MAATFVASSFLNNLVYNKKNQTLTVHMKGGKVYRYAKVPHRIYKGFLSADSKGRFYSHRVKGQYPAEKVETTA